MKKIFLIVTSNLLLNLSILTCAGCDKEINTSLPVDTTKSPTPPSGNTTSEKTYLALGDSYTIGQSVAVEDRFPAQAITILKQVNISFKEPTYIATTGWTTQNLINAIAQQNPQGPYDLVTLLVGVNDQYQFRDTTGYRQRFKQLLNKSVELAGDKPSHVIVLSIPDYSVTPFVPASEKQRVRQEIELFNLINKDVTLQANIKYLDITPSSREAATDASLIAYDGLHPSAKEYRKWAEALAQLARPIFQ